MTNPPRGRRADRSAGQDHTSFGREFVAGQQAGKQARSKRRKSSRQTAKRRQEQPPVPPAEPEASS